MRWPQIVMIVLSILTGLVALGKHGEPKGTYDVSVTWAALLLETWILWMGGFYS